MVLDIFKTGNAILNYHRICPNNDMSKPNDELVVSVSKFKEQLIESGHTYWGDYLIIQLIIQVFNLNLFILTQNEFTDIYEPYPLATIYDPYNNTIILLHVNDAHFKLVGHFQGQMINYFNHTNLPQEIKQLFKLK